MIGGETVMAVIQGTERGEFLGGTLSGDRIFGLGGDDLIQADPTFFDFVGGNDFVDGGSGNDQIFTFGGNDQVNSGSGNDAVQTADGVDRIDAGLGNDDVQSGRGKDIVLGQAGDDALRGGEDNDDLSGGDGRDRVIGGSGDDTLRDGVGVDQLEGRTGNDTAILTADRSTDTMVFMADDVRNGVDTIRGFSTAARNAGGDLIDIRQVAGEGFRLVENSGDVLIFVNPAGAVGLTQLARVEDVGDDAALADNILGGSGAGAALVADAGNGALIPLGSESEPVVRFAEVLGDDEPTEAAELLGFAQVLDDLLLA
jgi:RTX calcium-binding nonapeptide repeat (4 copies)